MFRKYHIYILQNNPRHREEEPKNIYSNICKTIIAKQQVSRRLQYFCKTRMDIKKCITKLRQTQNFHKQLEVH